MLASHSYARRLVRCRSVLALVVLGALIPASHASSQPTPDAAAPLRAGDVLQMSVPGRPEFEQRLVLDSTGRVDIPQVGEVRLGGLDLTEARLVLKQRLRLIAPTLDAVDLERSTVQTLRIYVLGQVGKPGAMEFSEIPTIWDVLRAVGGPLATADLRKSRVIHEGEVGPRVEHLDLSGVLEGVDFPAVILRPGDTLVIPALPDGVSGVPAARGVKVFGGVGVPSVVPVDGPTPLIDVLMLAGSPIADANIRKIWWVHAGSPQDEARLVNLRLFIESGDPEGNPLIHPGDTVQVGLNRPGALKTGLAYLLGTAATVATVYLALQRSGN